MRTISPHNEDYFPSQHDNLENFPILKQGVDREPMTFNAITKQRFKYQGLLSGTNTVIHLGESHKVLVQTRNFPFET